MEQKFMNRRMVIDNVPLIKGVLKGELFGYFDPAEQKVVLIKPADIETTPNFRNMVSVSLAQIAGYLDWTADDMKTAMLELRQERKGNQ